MSANHTTAAVAKQRVYALVLTGVHVDNNGTPFAQTVLISDEMSAQEN